MSYSSTTDSIIYSDATGSTATYPYTFKIFDESHLEVIKYDTNDDPTTLVLNTDYTVSGVGSASGGNVVLSSNLTIHYDLVIRRKVPLTQTTDLRNQGTYYPENVEDQLDKHAMTDLQQQFEISRSVRLPALVTPATFDPKLPADIASCELYVIRVNEDGDGLELVNPSDIMADVVVSSGSFVISDNNAVATAITDMTVDAADYSSAKFWCEYTRSTTYMGYVAIHLFRKNGTWVLHEAPSVGDAHGLTFSVTESGGIAQVKYTSDNTGAGTFKFKKVVWDA